MPNLLDTMKADAFDTMASLWELRRYSNRYGGDFEVAIDRAIHALARWAAETRADNMRPESAAE